MGLTRRVRGRAEFRSLAGGRRLRSGVLTLVRHDGGNGSSPGATQTPPRIAFAVPRSVGGSVVRNRVRRRLREAVRSQAPLLVGGVPTS
ncbi:MAG: ribonuclease P protein component [Acidimicrobiia bacterium]|nr:ribonuclease P protein component [Acidimicrobiia bacterium]